MCGIAGFISDKRIENSEKVIENMISRIVHRGPDDGDYKIYDLGESFSVGFGHRRLSIMDLSPNGKQPMESDNKRYSIVFNGEIYNFQILKKQLEKEGVKFRTQCDTEVILVMYEKYGKECLKHFNGMFAFVILDKEKKEVFAARDRLGVKPFYYYFDGDDLVFASEAKSILEFPKYKAEINYSVIRQCVESRFVKNPDTVLKDIKKLEPGHCILYKDKKLQIEKYWDITNFKKDSKSFKSTLQLLDEALQESVKLRMISDVPFGAFLSGGLDSSVIVALMSKYSDLPINTFSVGFKDSRHCELPYAKVIADHFKTNHHELVLTPEDIVSCLYDATLYRDAPVAETADIPILLLSREAKKSVSVILTGEGSDEIFGGYPKYAYDSFSKSPIFKIIFRNPIVSSAVNYLPYKYRKVKLAYNTLCVRSDMERYNSWFASFRNRDLENLFTPEFTKAHPEKFLQDINLEGLTNLDKMLYYDIKYWLSDNLLERGDKMLMGGSIEGRLPFLDYNVVELAFRIREKYKINGFNRKYILKKLAENYIPKEIIYRKKVGFYIPIGDWFRNDLKNFVYDHLQSEKFKQRGIFNFNEVGRIIKAHCSREHNYEKEIWMLLSLEIWMRLFIDGKESK